jgi:hypothetical protein
MTTAMKIIRLWLIISEKKTSQIIVPNPIVRDPKLKPLEFCMLLWFHYNTYLQKSDTIEIGLQPLKMRMNVSSDLTIKAAFNNLQNEQYILNDVKVINKTLMSIQLNTNKLERGRFFTQLPKNLFKKLDKVGHRGIRLLYYYESYINRSLTSNQFAYVGFKKIAEDTGIKKDAIDKYNEILVKEKLLSIEKHKAGYNGQYDDDDRQIWTKYNNHCEVRLDKILEL